MRTPTYLRALGGAAAVAVPLMFSVTTSTASTASSGTSTSPSNSPGKAAAKSSTSISPDAQSAHLDSKAQLLLTQVVFRCGFAAAATWDSGLLADNSSRESTQGVCDMVVQ